MSNDDGSNEASSKKLTFGGESVKVFDNEKKQAKSAPEWYSDLSDEQYNMFKRVFDLLDRDHDHSLDTDELYALLSNLDVDLEKDEIRSVLKDLDQDGDGVIDFKEFLYAMTTSDRYVNMLASENPDITLRQKPNGAKYSKRQNLFFTAITKFAMKNSLNDVQRYYKKKHAPHVIGHYTAGARLMGLSDRQIKRHYTELAESSANRESPYAKPVHFMAVRESKKAKSGRGKPRGRPQSAKDVKEQFEKLAEEGSVLAKIPDLLLLEKLRTKLESGELVREFEYMEHRKEHAHELHEIQLHKHDPKWQDLQPPWPNASGGHSVHRIRGANSLSYGRRRVPLPNTELPVGGGQNLTVDDLPYIREQVAKKLKAYYDSLRLRTIHNARKHWDELHVDMFPSAYLQDNFRAVYQAYSPHKREDAFVITPWVPPPSPGKYGCYGIVGHYNRLDRGGGPTIYRPASGLY